MCRKQFENVLSISGRWYRYQRRSLDLGTAKPKAFCGRSYFPQAWSSVNKALAVAKCEAVAIFSLAVLVFFLMLAVANFWRLLLDFRYGRPCDVSALFLSFFL